MEIRICSRLLFVIFGIAVLASGAQGTQVVLNSFSSRAFSYAINYGEEMGAPYPSVTASWDGAQGHSALGSLKCVYTFPPLKLGGLYSLLFSLWDDRQ